VAEQLQRPLTATALDLIKECRDIGFGGRGCAQGADQFDNAQACERAGAARVLLPEQVTVRAVRDAIVAVLDSGSPERTAALGLADEISAMPSAAQVADALRSGAAGSAASVSAV
jgi:UDP:flavonoid glycosyltransferase YjiC (YdhE family)